MDRTKYKGGPSPFKKHKVGDLAKARENIDFNKTGRLSKSYDKHAEDCFSMKGNRNKENIELFKVNVQDLAKSSDQVYAGSYRYQDPAFIFVKEINDKTVAVIINATNNEYITSINPTKSQLDDLDKNYNIGLDTRPSMQLTLRLRGPNNGSVSL